MQTTPTGREDVIHLARPRSRPCTIALQHQNADARRQLLHAATVSTEPLAGDDDLHGHRRSERLSRSQVAPFAIGQIAEVHLADADALEGLHFEAHELTHAADLALSAFAEDESELAAFGAGDLGGAELPSVEFEAVAEEGEGLGRYLARDAHEVFFVDRALTADDRAGDGAVLGEHQEAGGVDVESSGGREVLAVFWQIDQPAAIALVARGGRDEGRSVTVAVLRLTGDIAEGFVEEDGDLVAEFALGPRVQGELLGRQHLFTQLGDTFTIDEDEATLNEVVRFAAGTDAAGSEKFADAQGFVFGEFRGQWKGLSRCGW